MAAFGLGTPFQEQIDFLRNKLDLPSERWDDIQRSAHDRAFIVAGARKADLVQDFHNAITQRAIDGKGMAAWRKDFDSIVQKHGWSGWTGQGTKQGEAWRSSIIYTTNMDTSYAAGRWQQLTHPDLIKLNPYLRYVHADGVRHPRLHHLAWNGTTLPWDDPFWASHAAPNGWRCHCRIESASSGDYAAAKTEGKNERPAGWDEIDPKTGAPVGIDKGWDYNPGASAKRPMKDFIDQKLIKLDAPIGAAMWEQLRPVLAAEQGAAYRSWLARLATESAVKSEMPIIGALASADLLWLAENNKALPKTAEIAISSSVINGPKAIRHAGNGDGIVAGVWENLPEMLAEPLAVLFDNHKGTLLYVLPEASAKRPQLVVEFDYQRRERSKNMIISGYRPNLADLLNRQKNGSVTLIRGALE